MSRLIQKRSGIYLQDQSGTRRISATLTLGAISHPSSEITLLEIHFQNIHKELRTEFVPLSVLYSPSGKAKLVDLLDGFDWGEPQNVKLLNQMLIDRVPKAREKSPFVVVGSPGWHGNAYVTPTWQAGSSSTRLVFRADRPLSIAPYTLAGSVGEWKRTVAKPAQKSDLLRLLIGTAFAAPLLARLKINSFGFNVFGASSIGKTTAIRVAASVAGHSDNTKLSTWGDTNGGIESRRLGHRDGIFPIDELGATTERGRDKTHRLQAQAFGLSQNRGKRRSKAYEAQHGTTQHDSYVIQITTSEVALAAEANVNGGRRLTGEQVRLIDIPAANGDSADIFNTDPNSIPSNNADIIERLQTAIEANQGEPLRRMVTKLVRDRNALIKAQAYIKDFEKACAVASNDRAGNRISRCFAAVYAGAALAVDYGVLPWKKKTTQAAYIRYLQAALKLLNEGQSKPDRPSQGALTASLKDHINGCDKRKWRRLRNPSRKTLRRREECDAFDIDGELYVKGHVFARWFPDHRDRALLAQAGALKQGARKGTLTVEKKIKGIEGKPRYYVVILDRLK